METSSEEAMISPEFYVDSASPIWSIPDCLLSQIFTYVSVQYRIRLSEVCSRWAGVSRWDWTDIVSLDLSGLPKESIVPILRLCPKLQSVSARDCWLHVQSIAAMPRGELKSLSLYRVEINYRFSDDVALRHTPDHLCEAFLDELQSLPHLKDLVLDEVILCCFALRHVRSYVPFIYLPATLERLQITSGVLAGRPETVPRENRLADTLTCLILDHSTATPTGPSLLRSVALLMELGQLRELCLGSLFRRHIVQDVGRAFVENLACLEIFCLDIQYASANLANLAPLFYGHPTLRIIIITGEIGPDAAETLIPPRRRYSNGFGSDPLPFLHVFIGGQIAQKIRFARAPNDALEIHPITLPMPAFLEQLEVAAIFKDSWIAETIKKGVESNASLWDYDARMTQSFLVL